MDDTSKLRMNLSAIKKVDPYAKDIVETSPHVAFYTFNSEKNEWEKTDVEGAFFVYSRNAQPYHSVFINNRLNTTSFVEPVTGQLELQSQPPFLLYRNERSRIRGFWFYNSEECDRIGTLLKTLVEQNGGGNNNNDGDNFITSNQNNNAFGANGNHETSRVSTPKQSNVNIFNMLSKAQQEYNNSQAAENNLSNVPSGSVLKFFAAAKPTISANSEMPGQPVLPLSVEQLEQQQRTQTPVGIFQQHQQQPSIIPKTEPNAATHVTDNFIFSNIKQHQQQSPVIENNAATPFEKLFNQANFKKCTGAPVLNAHAATVNEVENQLRNLLVKDVLNASTTITSPAPVTPSTVSLLNSPLASSVPKEFVLMQKPALMPPTMFERSANEVDQNHESQPQQKNLLNQSQMVQALIHLMQNDQDFVQKLHEAYVKVSTSKTLVDAYH